MRARRQIFLCSLRGDGAAVRQRNTWNPAIPARGIFILCSPSSSSGLRRGRSGQRLGTATCEPCASDRIEAFKPYTSQVLARCLRVALEESWYSLRILLVFPWCSLGILLSFPGDPLRRAPAVALNDYCILTAKGWRLFERNHNSTSTFRRAPFAPGAGIPGRTCERGRRPWRWRTRPPRPVPPA